MVREHDAVYDRVAHIHIGTGHVDFGAQGVRALGVLSVAHLGKQAQVFFHAAVPPRAGPARLGQRAAVFAKLVGRKVADIRFPGLYQLDGVRIALVKVIRAVEDPAVRLRAQPANVLDNGAHVFVVLAHGVGIVKAQVEQAAVFLGRRPVDPYGFGAADVQVAVRLGREAGVYFLRKPCRNVGVYDVVYEI